MSNARKCPNCGGPLPDDMLDGLCRQCVLKQGVCGGVATNDTEAAKIRAEIVDGEKESMVES